MPTPNSGSPFILSGIRLENLVPTHRAFILTLELSLKGCIRGSMGRFSVGVGASNRDGGIDERVQVSVERDGIPLYCHL